MSIINYHQLEDVELLDEKAFKVKLGENLKNHRKEKKIRQEDLAKVLELTRTSITNIEKGTQSISLYNLYLMCIEFKVSPEELFPDFDSFRNSLNQKQKATGQDLLDQVLRSRNIKQK